MSDTAASIEARSGPGIARGIGALLIAAATLGISVGLGLAVSAHPGTGLDGATRQWALAANRPAGVTALAFVSTAGSVTPMIVYACVVVAVVAMFRRSMAPLTALFAPVAPWSHTSAPKISATFTCSASGLSFAILPF
ncbi:hypothetical protein BH11GEM2_BH11GEM2_15940 [soil metagenome]